jgi:hypothetical protein
MTQNAPMENLPLEVVQWLAPYKDTTVPSTVSNYSTKKTGQPSTLQHPLPPALLLFPRQRNLFYSIAQDVADSSNIEGRLPL